MSYTGGQQFRIVEKTANQMPPLRCLMYNAAPCLLSLPDGLFKRNWKLTGADERWYSSSHGVQPTPTPAVDPIPPKTERLSHPGLRWLASVPPSRKPMRLPGVFNDGLWSGQNREAGEGRSSPGLTGLDVSSDIGERYLPMPPPPQETRGKKHDSDLSVASLGSIRVRHGRKW